MIDSLPDDWDDKQRAIFNRVYRHMLFDQGMFTHPDAQAIDMEHWRTICWNAAWMAGHVSGADPLPLVHIDENGSVIGAELTNESKN